MPVRGTPESITGKWVRNLSAATTAIQEGVQRVQTAPGQAAAAQEERWAQRLMQSREKWRRRVAAVSLEEWRQAMVQVGLPRVAQGAQAKQNKMRSFMAEFLPHLERGLAQIERMPAVTLEDGINRAVAMIRHNASFRRGGGGS